MGQVIERDECGRVVLAQRVAERVGLTVPGPDQVLMATGQDLDRVDVGTVTSDRPVIVPVGADQIRKDFRVARVGLRSRNIVTLAIARDRERVDRIQLIAGSYQRLDPQAAIGFDPDDDLVRVFRVISDELVERVDPSKAIRQSPSLELLTGFVHQMNVVMIFCPVVADEQHRGGLPSPELVCEPKDHQPRPNESVLNGTTPHQRFAQSSPTSRGTI